MPVDNEESTPTWDNFRSSSQFTPAVKKRIAREVNVIHLHWGVDWRARLQSNKSTASIHIQDTPSFQLALTLGRLAAFQPDINLLLSSLTDFNAYRAAQLPRKNVDPRTPDLFGTIEQRVNCTSYRYLEAWLEWLKNPPPPPAVTQRSMRANERQTKRSAPASSPRKAPRHRRRCVTSAPSVEIGRGQEITSRESRGNTAQEEPTLLDAGSEGPKSCIDDCGVLIDDEQLAISSLQDQEPSGTSLTVLSVMATNLTSFLLDPDWSRLTKLLLLKREKITKQHELVIAAKTALGQAQDEYNKCLAKAHEVLGDEEATIDRLKDAIVNSRADLRAEEALHSFLTKHEAEYQRLAGAATSAANQLDALDTMASERAISDLASIIEGYEAALNRLEETKADLQETQEAYEQSKLLVRSNEMNRKTFYQLVGSMENDLLFGLVSDELAQHAKE